MNDYTPLFVGSAIAMSWMLIIFSLYKTIKHGR